MAFRVLALFAPLLLLALAPALGAPAVGFGHVDMPNSCAQGVQAGFEQALAKLHDFEAGPGDFEPVLRADPGCAIALWAAAMSVRGNPLAGSLDDNALRAGRSFIDKAIALQKGSPEERALIGALDVYFRPYAGGQAARTIAYSAAMEDVYRGFPDDVDVDAFYALSLLEAVDLGDATYARQRKAGAILEKLRTAHPDHPGAAHYLIHAYDYPALAEGAVAAADIYPSLAPASSHAQHMPAHIWSMLGEWRKSIEANHRSGIVADPAAARSVTTEDLSYAHAFDFIAYARLQLGQDRQIERDLQAEHGHAPLIVKARYALERDDWNAAAALAVPADDPFDAAVARFTRALGAARSGGTATARYERNKLVGLRAAVVQSEGAYWGGLVDIYAKAAQAWIEEDAGHRDQALADMRAAADLDDALQKHILLENKLVPMRELLGDMLMAQSDPAAALQAYRTALQHAPHRYRSLLGVARAAKAAGDQTASRDAFRDLLQLTRDADTLRPGIAQARQMTGG